MCKTDNAREFAASCGIIGLVPEPALARRWPHNATQESEIRTHEEVTRSVHLAAGFHLFTGLWKHAVSYGCVAMNQFHPLKNAPEGESSNRFVRATGREFEGRHLLLDPLERHKFEAAASPALFAGWRFDEIRFRSKTTQKCALHS